MQDYHFERLLNDPKTFLPEARAVFIEVYLFADESQDIFEDTVLEPGHIFQGVALRQFNGEQPISTFRLLVLPLHNCNPKTGLPKATNETHENPVPLSRHTFEAVSREFSLPTRFLSQHTRRIATFQHRHMLHGISASSNSFGFTHQTSANSKAYFSMGGSYDASTATTSVVLCGLHDTDIEIGELKLRLKMNRRETASPLLLPLTLLDLRMEYLHERLNEVQLSLHATKYVLSVDNTLSLPAKTSTGITTKKETDLAAVSRDVTRAMSTAASTEYGCEVHLPMVHAMARLLDACHQATVNMAKGPESQAKKALCAVAAEHVGGRIQEYIPYMDGVKSRTRYLTQRGTVYAQTVSRI